MRVKRSVRCAERSDTTSVAGSELAQSDAQPISLKANLILSYFWSLGY